MKIARGMVVFSLLAGAGMAQLTSEQRLADFQYLANLYAQRYAPYEWKRTALNYDMLDLAPWLERVRNAQTDIDFYEICSDYVGSLYDAHDGYYLPSTFEAWLGFSVDIYDGKVLIDSISRHSLPLTEYPFQVGDELVSVDDRTAEELIGTYLRFSRMGNPRTARRYAASLITYRPQQELPRAPEVGDSAQVAIRRADGNVETYTIRWMKSGIPVGTLAPGRSPYGPKTARRKAAAKAAPEVPPWLKPVRELQMLRLPKMPGVLGMGELAPTFAMPEGFEVRLGNGRYDDYYSGTYPAGGYRLGYIRIPDFMYRSVYDFEDEINYFQENTDGLVIDITRNPGGYICLAEDLLAHVIPYPFQVMQSEIRVNWSSLLNMMQSRDEAIAYGEDPTVIDFLNYVVSAYEEAYRGNGALTKPLPLCGLSATAQPAVDDAGNQIAYTKPVLVLADEMTASCGDIFAAVIQDARRGPLFGMRTMGAGGSPSSFSAGIYSEGAAAVTQTLMRRKDPVPTPDYPTTAYVENVGVRPEVDYDFMTRDNLMQLGKPFVDAFTAKLVELIQQGSPAPEDTAPSREGRGKPSRHPVGSGSQSSTADPSWEAGRQRE